MNDLLRREVTTLAHTVVVKVGTRVLTAADGTLNEHRIACLAEELCTIRDAGRRVVLVSSGAVGAGMGQLGLKKRPTDLGKLQAVAAVGQTNLIETYDRVFRRFHRRAAQVLLTAEDVQDRDRCLNVRNTLWELLDFGVIPVVNENDTVSVEELMPTFGDNDRLAALVTTLVRAPLLVILSDVGGLYTGDPADANSTLIPLVPAVDEAVRALVRDKATGLSKGGMASKLEAARIVTAAGENAIIANGRDIHVLGRVMAGEAVGTLFLAQGKAVSPRKRWLAFSSRPRGKLILDAGAARAIARDGRSLLAIGIQSSQGDFQKGDIVAVYDPQGQEIARGLTNYCQRDIEHIKGLKSNKIAQVLGGCPYEEVIHRDNLAVVGVARV